MELQTLGDTRLLEKLKKVFHNCEYIGSCSNQEVVDYGHFSYLFGSTAVRWLVSANRVGVLDFLAKVFWFSLIVLFILTLVSISSLYTDDLMVELRAVGAGYYYFAAFAFVVLISVLDWCSRKYLWYKSYPQGGYAMDLTDEESFVDLSFWYNEGIRFNREKCVLIKVNVGGQYNFFIKSY